MATANFTLGGTFVQNAGARLAVASASQCDLLRLYFSAHHAVTLTATISNTGGPSSTSHRDRYCFANGAQIGSPELVSAPAWRA